MKGYLLNFYRHSTKQIGQAVQGIEVSVDSNHNQHSIVWSTYDEIWVHEIDKFSLCKQSGEDAYNWMGERRYVMLYDMASDNQLTLLESEKRDKFPFRADNVENRFFGITYINFSPQIYNMLYCQYGPHKVSVNEFIKECLDSIVTENKLSADLIQYGLYGTIGESDVIIIWIANKYKEIAIVANGFEKSMYYESKIAARVSTLIGLTDLNDEIISGITFYECDAKPAVFHSRYDIYFNEDITYHNDNIYDKLQKLTKLSLLKCVPYLGEALWDLYAEYVQTMYSMKDYPWVADLDYQLDKSTDYLLALCHEDNLSSFPNKRKFECIELIVKALHDSISYISGFDRLYGSVQRNDKRNNKKIIRSYIGIVKELLEVAYNIPRNCNQVEVIPFIELGFNPIPNIKSCPVMEGYNVRVVLVELPFEAFTNIPKHTRLLAHEVYHCIAPCNLRTRNMVVLTLVYTYVIMLILRNYLLNDKNDMIMDRENIVNEFMKITTPKIYEYVDKNKEIFFCNHKMDSTWDKLTDEIVYILKEKEKFPCMVYICIKSITLDIPDDAGESICKLKELLKDNFKPRNPSNKYAFITWMNAQIEGPRISSVMDVLCAS